MKNRNGFIDPVTLCLIAGIAIGFVAGSWKPLNYFKKPPDTKQLTELQVKLESTQKQAEQARIEREAAVVAERAKLESQVRAAQVDNSGTQIALSRIPASNQSPEIKLASRMANRVSLKLTAAIGKLPESEQNAMIELIDQALSDKQAEVDEANRKLAAMDADFKALTHEREQIKAQIPLLNQRAARAEEQAELAQAEVTKVTNEVKEKADKLYKATQENGTLWSSVKNMLYIAGAAYVTLVFIIPGLVKHLDAGMLKTSLRAISGYTTSPLLFHDATKKIPTSNPTGNPDQGGQ